MPLHSNDEYIEITVSSSLDVISSMKVLGMRITEELSRPYRYLVTTETPPHSNPRDVDPEDLLDQTMTVVVDRGGRIGVQEYTGVIAAVELIDSTNDSRQVMHLELIPRLGLMALGSASRLFADQSIEDVIGALLDEHRVEDVALNLQRSYPPTRNGFLQYRETHLDFLHRLLESEGIFYYFQHQDGKAKLTLGDHANAHPASSAGPTLSWRTRGTTALSRKEGLISERVCLSDYKPNRPGEHVLGEQAVGTGISPALSGLKPRLINLLAPAWRGDDGPQAYAATGAEILASRRRRLKATTHYHSIRAGVVMNLTDHPDETMNGEYLIISSEQLIGRDPSDYSNSANDSRTKIDFVAVPCEDLPWRPERRTPWPTLPGLMRGFVTATVDTRDGPGNEGSYLVSTMLDPVESPVDRIMPMAQPFAGVDYGFHLPLPVGAEVLIAHIGGDPDRPVIVAAMPNVDHPSPVGGDNPDHLVLRSRLHNEIRIEDVDGSSMLAIVATKDHSLAVAENSTSTVGVDASLTIDGTNTTIVKGDVTESFEANLATTIGANHEHQVDGAMTVGIDGDLGIASKAAAAISADSGITITSPQAIGIKSDSEIVLEVGGNSITISTSGIKIKAMKVEIGGDTGVEVSAPGGAAKFGGLTAEVSGQTTLKLSGAAMAELSSGGMTAIKGSMVKTN